jgi:hypothetical protein
MKNKTRVSLFVAGGVSAFFTVIHCLMSYAIQSNRALISPDATVWAILQTLNSVCILMVAAMTYFSFRHTNELVNSSLGKSLLVVFGIYYLVRIVSEFVFFGFSGVGSVVIIVLCLIPALSYLFVAVSPSQTQETGIISIIRGKPSAVARRHPVDAVQLAG